MTSVTARLSKLRRDRRGASVLELGLALPILMTVLLGLIDVASAYSAQMSIQQAAARSLERLQVGNARNNFDFVRQEAAAAAGVPVANVSVQDWLECNREPMPAGTQDCTGAVPRARYVQVTITSAYTPYFSYSPLGPRNAQGNVALSANSSVRYQ